jgi:phage shock protein C
MRGPAGNLAMIPSGDENVVGRASNDGVSIVPAVFSREGLPMSLAEEIQKLHVLCTAGAITEEEYAHAKDLLLSGTVPTHIRIEDDAGRDRPTSFLNQFARSNHDYWLGGVCGGLGERTPVPSWCWRLGFCAMALMYGVGVIPYVLLWIFAPVAPSQEHEPFAAH